MLAVFPFLNPARICALRSSDRPVFTEPGALVAGRDDTAEAPVARLLVRGLRAAVLLVDPVARFAPRVEGRLTLAFVTVLEVFGGVRRTPAVARLTEFAAFVLGAAAAVWKGAAAVVEAVRCAEAPQLRLEC